MNIFAVRPVFYALRIDTLHSTYIPKIFPYLLSTVWNPDCVFLFVQAPLGRHLLRAAGDAELSGADGRKLEPTSVARRALFYPHTCILKAPKLGRTGAENPSFFDRIYWN